MSGANTEFARLHARTQLTKHGLPFVESGFNGRKNPKKGENGTKQEREVLIVSCRPENRKTLVRMLDELSINSYVAPTVRHAREVLASQSLSLVFCEERLPDGSYSDLLKSVRAAWRETRFVVILCTGEWGEYLEAMRLGAQEVLRCPLSPNGYRSGTDPSDETEETTANA